MKANEHNLVRIRASLRNRLAFTLIELLVVIAIMAILAGLLVGLAPVASARMKEARVKSDLNRLVLAIESYKVRYGVYPPDNLVDPAHGLVNSVTNPLFYELSGTIVSNIFPDSGYFVSVAESDVTSNRLNATTVERFFNRDGFVNAAVEAQRRRLFQHEFKDSESAALVENPQVRVLVAPFPWPRKTTYNVKDPVTGVSSPVDYPPPFGTSDPRLALLNPWRYVSSNPTNNPNSYDLWCEIIVKGQKKIIGNWKN